MSKRRKELPVVGWRELVHLPELGLHEVPAKIDTGARTSSLHGQVVEEFERNGEKYVRRSDTVTYEFQVVVAKERIVGKKNKLRRSI